MVTKISLAQNKEPVIRYPSPMPLMTTDIITFGYLHSKEGNVFNLGLRIVYQVKDTLGDQLYNITIYESYYKVESDGTITVEDLYEVCKHCVHGLKMWLDLHSRVYKTPPTGIRVPELSKMQRDLQIEVDWFHSN
jgi:hypothetical protein